MNKIDISEWHPFKLVDLFNVTGSKTTAKKDILFDANGQYPYVTTQATNNGVAGLSNQWTEEGNVITIDSATIGYASYQKENFTASDHVEKLIPKFTLNEKRALFIVTILNEMRLNYRYGYEDKRSQTALKKEQIYLPTKDGEEPDWEYMEEYVETMIVESIEYLKILERLQ